MSETAHDDCTTCEWLAREAERTAKRQGRDHWLSTTEENGITHTARYQEES